MFLERLWYILSDPILVFYIAISIWFYELMNLVSCSSRESLSTLKILNAPGVLMYARIAEACKIQNTRLSHQTR